MSIGKYLDKIRNAVYGREVRESIAKGIETAYNDAAEKHDNANMEVKLARGTHSNLNNRLKKMDEVDEQTTAQLAQTHKKNEQTIGWSNITQEAREYMLGDKPMPVVGEGSVGGLNIVDGAIEMRHLKFAEQEALPYEYYFGRFIEYTGGVMPIGTLSSNNGSQNRKGIYLKLEPNTSYSVSNVTGGMFRMGLYDVDISLLDNSQQATATRYVVDNSLTDYTFTTEKNSIHFFLQIDHESTSNPIISEYSIGFNSFLTKENEHWEVN